MFLSGSDVHDVADSDLALLGFRGDFALASRDYENLIAIVHMPPRRRPDAEIHDVAAKVFRLPVANHRLSRPAHRPPVHPAIGVAVSIGFS